MPSKISKALTLILISVVALNLGGCRIYQSLGKSIPGSWLHPVNGPEYALPSDVDMENNALLVIYRPDSKWASEEIESPSFYIDDEREFGIKNNAHYWFEVEPGKRHLVIRRPLLGLEGVTFFSLRIISDFTVDLKAGQTYFLRYSELTAPPMDKAISEEEPMGDGALFLIPEALAKRDLLTTMFDDQSGRFLTYKMEYHEPEQYAALEEQKSQGEGKWWWPF
ncbi:DUF2846 domain-containing protein [Litoribacillus peritrichatus]|uniref:DUF2846 domain-containing protein n=1 Tax=Litoribacillus peritrichatus TaxID=718191 RepID=A0ABP7M576_9GAMM